MDKRAVIYARVSTDEQAERGYSLPTQLEACKRYAEQKGFTITAELADDCSGSIPIIERPQGKRIYELIERRQVDAVIMYTQDRTARDERVLEYLLFKDHLYSRGLELHYSDSGYDPYTMEGNLVGYIKAHAASEERKKIKERTMRGKNAKARNGKPVMIGHPPYGYRREGKGNTARLYIYETEAEVVKKIFEWYTRGDGNNGPLALRAIAIKLEETGEPTPNNRSNAAKHWIPATIRGILTNEIYTGRTYYGKSRIIDGKRVKQPLEEWIPVDVPELAIIDRESFEIVLKRAEKNRILAKRNRKYDYLLSGYFRCGACEGAMAGSYTKAKGYLSFYYRCGNHWHRPEQEPCPNEGRTISARISEGLVWEWFSDLLESDAKLKKGMKRLQERTAAELEPKRQRLESVNVRIEKAERKIQRLVEALGDEEDKIIRETFKAETKTVARHLESLQAEKEQLERDLARKVITPAAQERIIQFVDTIRRKLVSPTYAQKRELFDLFNLQVIFRIDDSGRWLDVKCYMNTEGDVIVLDHSSKMLHNYEIVFFSSLPLDRVKV